MNSEILLLITRMKKYKLLIISIECIFFISCKEVHQDPLPANTKGCKEMVEINIDLDKNIMANSDIRLLNLIYKIKIMKALSAKIQYELRDSKNYRNDNDTLTLSATYTF